MSFTTKPVKVSTRVEGRLAQILDADRVHFKRVKFVNTYIFRFTFFVEKHGQFVGTLNYFWDTRKMFQWIFLKRFSDKAVMRLRDLNNYHIKDFFAEE